MKPSDIIIRPLTTEKSLINEKEGKYTFLVNQKANKSEIKKAIEVLYNIKIVKISTTTIKEKIRMLKKGPMVKRPYSKKATVTTKDKKKITISKVDIKK